MLKGCGPGVICRAASKLMTIAMKRKDDQVLVEYIQSKLKEHVPGMKFFPLGLPKDAVPPSMRDMIVTEPPTETTTATTTTMSPRSPGNLPQLSGQFLRGGAPSTPQVSRPMSPQRPLIPTTTATASGVPSKPLQPTI